MTDKVQKIRNEVEKLKSNLMYGACSSQVAMETRCKEEAYNEVLSIMDSMQEEPKECMYSKDNYTDEDRKALCDGCEEECEFNKKKVAVSKDWSAEFDKILEPYKNSHNYKKLCLILRWWKSNYERWWHWKLNKKEEPISDDLEEAAIQFATDTETGKVNVVKQSSFFWGAIYHKQQVMKNAVDGVVHRFDGCGVASVHYNDPNGVSMAYFIPSEGLSAGDKVKIITIKED